MVLMQSNYLKHSFGTHCTPKTIPIHDYPKNNPVDYIDKRFKNLIIMNDQSSFIAKVFLVSLGIALLIKAAALWMIPESSNLGVLVIVLLPSLVITIILTSRAVKILGSEAK